MKNLLEPRARRSSRRVRGAETHSSAPTKGHGGAEEAPWREAEAVHAVPGAQATAEKKAPGFAPVMTEELGASRRGRRALPFSSVSNYPPLRVNKHIPRSRRGDRLSDPADRKTFTCLDPVKWMARMTPVDLRRGFQSE